jgi:hypothetical protein
MVVTVARVASRELFSRLWAKAVACTGEALTVEGCGDVTDSRCPFMKMKHSVIIAPGVWVYLGSSSSSGILLGGSQDLVFSCMYLTEHWTCVAVLFIGISI